MAIISNGVTAIGVGVTMSLKAVNCVSAKLFLRSSFKGGYCCYHILHYLSLKEYSLCNEEFTSHHRVDTSNLGLSSKAMAVISIGVAGGGVGVKMSL